MTPRIDDRQETPGDGAFTSSLSLLVTPPTSPSTLDRRKQGARCVLEPPTLKRKRDDHPNSHMMTMASQQLLERDERFMNFQNQNKRRVVSSSSSTRHFYFAQYESLPTLSIADFTGASNMPRDIVQAGTLPVLSLRPRTSSFAREDDQEPQETPFLSNDIVHEQNENVPPRCASTRTRQETMRFDSAPEIATTSSSTLLFSSASSLFLNHDSEGNDAIVVSSPRLKQGSLTLRKSSATKSSLGSAAAAIASAMVSTPLSLSRKLSFGTNGSYHARQSSSSSNNNRTSSNHHRRRSNSCNYQTPTCKTTTLIQSLEGLCLPSLEDIDGYDGMIPNIGGLGSGTNTVATRTTLQQKRLPTTPHQGNYDHPQRSMASTTFDYLATALRLPDIALSGGSANGRL